MVWLLTLFFAVCSVTAQQPTPAPATSEATFEAVSIREARGGQAFSGMRPHPSGLTATDTTAMDLIRYAFEIIESDVVGDLPGWIRTKKFDVVARSSGEPLTYTRLRLMVRALLRDRLRLDATFERTEAEVYAMVLERSDGKWGPNLRPSTSTCIAEPLVREPSVQPVKVLRITSCGAVVGTNIEGLNSIIGNRVTMQKLARAISRYGRFDLPVVDQTGLSGEFDIMALVSADIAGATIDARFLTAMREQLGLTIRRGQGVLDVLRIRRIEQPSPN